MDMEALKRELESNGTMQAVTQSAEARKLMGSIDAAAVENAAKKGDAAALKGMLTKVLSTPEGKALAEKVREAVKRNG